MAVHNASSLLERAHVQHRAGNLIEAAKSYRKFLKQEPGHPVALYLLGCLEYQRGRYGEAVDILLEAIGVDPRDADAQNTLGLALTALDQDRDAELSFRRALEIEDRAAFHINFALLRKKQGRLAEAEQQFQLALALDASDTVPLCELGDLLQARADLTGAADAYTRALALNPELARAWYSLGCVENERREYVEAAKYFRAAVDLDGLWLQARHNLARALYEIGGASEAWRNFQFAASQERLAASAQSRAMLAVIAPGVPEAGNREILDVRRAWAQRDLPSSPPKVGAPLRSGGDRPLRIGYVSSFFQRDNWMKPVWGLIDTHDRERFQVSLFSDAPLSEIHHGYHAHSSDRYFDTAALSNEALRDLIREARIDILIDLNGYSNMRRLPLFALRPAPVAIGWFNFYATSGISAFDYLIGDEVAIPREDEPFYTEKILRVPGSYLTFSVDYPVPPVAQCPHIANRGAITFGSLASQYKLTAQTVDLWSVILNATPSSRLLLKNQRLASATTQELVRKLFQHHGIAPRRLILEGPEEHFAFLQAYDRIDIALDPFPYNGGTTTTEALWQGVPVIAFKGDRWASRTSASILMAAGLSEFVADNPGQCVALAADWAASPKRLIDLRRSMRARLSASSVCDTAAFARNMEALYTRIYSAVEA